MTEKTTDCKRVSLYTGIWWFSISVLVLYGLFFIYSAGYISADYPVRNNWLRQFVWCLLGSVICWCVSRLKPGSVLYRLFVWSGYWLSLLGVCLVMILGRTVGGARRWLSIGSLMVQPAEYAKVFTILAVSAMLCSKRSLLQRVLLGLLLGVMPFLLIVFEPSVGNACVLFPAILALAGVYWMWHRLWRLLMVGLVAVLVIGCATVVWVRNHPETLKVNMEAGGMFRGYHIRRFSNYLDAKGDWNERQALWTLVQGGLVGKGYLEGTMNRLGYLPRPVAPTDFIFAVICEEMGFLFGALPIIALFGIVFAIALHWGGHAADENSALNCVGIVTMLFTHVVINIGMNVRLVPIIGLPLPLLSYGGSFTLAVFIGLGVIYGTAHRLSSGDEGRAPASFSLWRLAKITISASTQTPGT